MSWGTITDEGIAAAATLIGMPLRRERMQWIETATRDAIRHFAWGVGDDNPLWFDREYGAASPWGTILAPPCILYAVDSTIIAPKLPGVQWVYAGTDWTWYEPIRLGDSFRVVTRLLRQEKKTGRRFPFWVLQIGESRYYNQDDRLVAVAVGRCARTPRGDKLTEARGGKEVEEHKAHKYTAVELEDIEQQGLNERRTGNRPLYWEDVAVGMAIPPVVKGPLSIIDIMAWYSCQQGAQPYGGAHTDAVRYRRRHADYHVNPATGAKDAAGRGHLEAATGRDVGMGGAYDIGPQRISWAQHMLTNWVGDHGFLHHLDVAVRRPNLVGDTLWWRGTVVGKEVRDGTCMADLEVVAVNQSGIESATGSATVALPSRQHGPLRMPLAAAE